MKIQNLRVEKRGARRRVAADIVWETSERSPQTLSFETSSSIGEDLQPSPDAFLLASLPFAVWWGEDRIQIEGSLCTSFRDGMHAVMSLYSQWFERCRLIDIEPLGGYAPTEPRSPPRTGSFLSGGVDGLAALRSNRLSYPRSHPAAVSDCLLLFGANDFDYSAEGPVPERLAAFGRLEDRLRGIAEAEEFQLISIHTNARLLSGGYDCWAAVGFGAANVAPAHALSRRFSSVLFASDGGGVDPPPGASHPLLDQHFSTAAVRVCHTEASWSRIDKLRLLAEWPEALRIMQPCHYVQIPPAGCINCGRCEKCVRTMLGLLSLDRLAHADAFEANDVSAEMIRAIPLRTPIKVSLLEQLAGPLREAGRGDLARVIEYRVAVIRRRERWRRLAPDSLRRAKQSLATMLSAK